MAVELRRLIEKVAHMDVTCIAGKNGLHHLVTWVHMVETVEAGDFLEGGEIAFTTGLGLSNHVNLLDLTKLMYQKKVAGVIVNTGPFIETIPEDVITFCDTHDFPLFIIPWKIHLAEVMRIFCFAITKDEQRILETTAAFKNAIFFPKQEELYVVPLSQQGFRVDWNYAVCMMFLANSTSISSTRLEQLVTGMDTYARHKYKNFSIFLHDSEILVVAADYTNDQLHSFILDLYSRTSQILASGEAITMGCGKLTKSIRCLYKSYQQAKSIQRLQRNGRIDPSLVFYSDLGIYKLLMNIDERDSIQEYFNDTIQPLIDYDVKNDSDLTSVLHCYLKHNGSVKETADELYVHRNTVNYKLTRISEILDMDLSQLEVRLQLIIGFMLQDML